jgi:hypothetical protein
LPGRRDRDLSFAGGFCAFDSGEYAGNIFWIVGFSLIPSWIVTWFSPRILAETFARNQNHQGGMRESIPLRDTSGFAASTTCKKFTMAGMSRGRFSSRAEAWRRRNNSFQTDQPELLVEVQLPLHQRETTSAATR